MSLLDEVGKTISGIFSDPERRQGAFKLATDLLNSPEIGGIGGLVKSFQEKGLGEIISSWISAGQNLPISAEQIQQVLGSETLQKITTNTSLPQESVASDLSALLPEIIDKLTPAGEIGEPAMLEKSLDLLKERLLGSGPVQSEPPAT